MTPHHPAPRSRDQRHSEEQLAESQRREGEGAALERQRIARDLHDSVSQSLFSTTLHVRTAQHALELQKLDADRAGGGGAARDRPVDPGRAGRDARLIFELQPGALAEEGLVAALTEQASALSAREGLVIEVDGPDGRLPLGPEAEEQLYRGQEALANVVKHARARSHGPHRRTDDTVSIEVSDDGRGFDPPPWSRPLRSTIDARPRRDLGGRLRSRARPAAVPSLRVEVPAQR